MREVDGGAVIRLLGCRSEVVEGVLEVWGAEVAGLDGLACWLVEEDGGGLEDGLWEVEGGGEELELDVEISLDAADALLVTEGEETLDVVVTVGVTMRSDVSVTVKREESSKREDDIK